MKKIKLLLTSLVLILIMALCMGCKNEITGTSSGSGDTGTDTSTDNSGGENPVFVSGKYELSVKNDSTQLGNFCIYQIYPDQDNNDKLYSLAWMSKTVHPNQIALFEWNTDFSFVWSETGKLETGVKFSASQNSPADTQNQGSNIIVLSKKDGAFLFKDALEQGQKNVLTIKADGTIPNNRASIGVGMNGAAAIVINAAMNMTYQFTPTPTYWIIFGDFVEGEVLDLKIINPTRRNIFSTTMQIIFPPNEEELSVSFGEDNTWSVIE